MHERAKFVVDPLDVATLKFGKVKFENLFFNEGRFTKQDL